MFLLIGLDILLIVMPDQPFKFPASRDESDEFEKPPVTTRELIEEALARQAAIRPALSPPREMPVTPTLPRQPKPARQRKRKRR